VTDEPRGYALARGEGLDGDTSLKASGASSGGAMTLIESHTDGGFVFMPRGVVHDWDVEGETASVLILAAPGGLERFLDEFHAAGDWPARDEVAERYGLTFPR
jgi:hypothetical protein